MKTLKKISDILGVVPIALALIIALISAITDWTFLAGTINGNVLTAILFSCSAFFMLVSTISAIITKDEKQTAKKSILNLICVIILCIIMIFTKISDNKDLKYYEFTSPDSNYTVVAEERTHLKSGIVRFYERKNPFFVIHKDFFTTDDCYRPISSGDYKIEWNENIMCFTANNGNNVYKTTYIII